MDKQVIRTDRAAAPGGHYSQGMKWGNLVFTAGQGGKNPATGEMAPDIKGQTRQALENIKASLEEAGTSLDNCLKATVFLRDFNDFSAMNEVYATYFPKDPPVRSIGSADFPGEMIVEIDVIACIL